LDEGCPDRKIQQSARLVADGLLYVRTSTGRLHALSPSTGKELWTAAATSSTVVSEGVIYSNSGETLIATDAKTGKRLWHTTIDNGRLTRPAVAGGVVYCHSTVGKLYAFDTTDRKTNDRLPLWVGKTSVQEKGDGARSVAVGHGKVFVGANSTFYAFDTARDGKSERTATWTAKVETPFFSSSPSVANGVVFSAAGNHDIYAFDAASGKVLWNFRSRGLRYPMRSKPTIVDGRLFHAATFSYKLYVFELPEDAADVKDPEGTKR
jgi:eukaryotic-like serine/threonine-protein kinase